jgi:hypothetical protein
MTLHNAKHKLLEDFFKKARENGSGKKIKTLSVGFMD